MVQEQRKKINDQDQDQEFDCDSDKLLAEVDSLKAQGQFVQQRRQLYQDYWISLEHQHQLDWLSLDQ